MNIIEGGVLGLIQGITEFIPVSSSGHLVIGQYLFHHSSDHLFVEFINIGTVLALLIYFWPRIISAVKQVFIEHDYRLARNIIVSALPAGAIGLILADFISTNAFFANIWVVITALAAVGVVMVLLEKLPRSSLVKEGSQLGWRRSLAVGCAQVFALVPGVSRSGSTIIAGRLMGMPSAPAAEYSFLLSIPIMLGVIAKLFMSDRAYFFDNWQLLLVSNIIAFVIGLLAVRFLMQYLSHRSLAAFGWYRIGLAGALAIGILLLQ